MTATLTIFAAETPKADPKAEQKARRKAEKKRHNKQLEILNHGLSNVREVLDGVLHRVAEARKAVQGVDAGAPTQALSDYLDELQALLAQGVALSEDKGLPAQEAVAEHFFPGRAAKWAAEDEERYQDTRYAQQERSFGA